MPSSATARCLFARGNVMAHVVRSKTCRSWIARIAVITAFGMSSAAGAADLGANCCSDLDERITELEKTAVRSGNRKIQLQISGTVNRALLYWNDGNKRDVYIVDPAVDNTSFKLDGSAKIGGGWKAGYQLKIEAIVAASDGVDQVKARGEDGEVFKPDRSYFFLDQEKLGRITVGRTNSASRGIDNIELTGAETTSTCLRFLKPCAEWRQVPVFRRSREFRQALPFPVLRSRSALASSVCNMNCCFLVGGTLAVTGRS